ncbi:MAG: HNH endonuclease [Proteobacteria bacterium]|nr:MAG: HNH endonuclease [Pseudomonadota bacterium]
MPNCYACTKPITRENHSLEHIFNNSIGGSLSSRELLCKTCNERFGDTIDAELSGQLGDLAALLEIKRDRKTAEQPITMISESGHIKQVGPGMRPHARLSFPAAEKKVELFASESKYAKLVRDKTKELSKKQEVVFVESTELPTTEKYYIKNKFHDGDGFRRFGGFQMHRSVVKMCVNRYLYKGYDPVYCQLPIAFVDGNEKPYIHFYYFPTHYHIHELRDGEVSNIIHIRGDRRNGVVYAYIEIFNFENALVIFDMDFEGEDFEDTYAIDTFSGEEIEKKITIRLTRNHFEDLHLIARDFDREYIGR